MYRSVRAPAALGTHAVFICNNIQSINRWRVPTHRGIIMKWGRAVTLPTLAIPGHAPSPVGPRRCGRTGGAASGGALGRVGWDKK